MLCLTAPEQRATACAAGAAATALPAELTYARHASERTLLYALAQAHYPDFMARLDAEDRSLPEYVRKEFEAFLHCGVLDHGFLRVVCEQCRSERLVAFSRLQTPIWGAAPPIASHPSHPRWRQTSKLADPNDPVKRLSDSAKPLVQASSRLSVASGNVQHALGSSI